MRGGKGTSRCSRCGFPPTSCLCAELPRFQPRMQLVVVRHVAEKMRMSNSARWTVDALEGAVLHDHGGRDDPPFDIPKAGTWLLFPGNEPSPLPSVLPERIVAIDGSWAQARRMSQRLPQLHGLQHLSLPAGPRPIARLRDPGFEEGMSTLEAIALAYDWAGEPHIGEGLRRFYGRAVETLFWLKGLPLPPA